jgi:hypothetical protein
MSIPLALNWRTAPNLQRKEILKFGPELLESTDKLKCPKNVNPDLLYFILKCVSDLIRHQKYFKFSSRQRKDVVKMCKPFESKLRKIANDDTREKNVKLMRSRAQRGGGIFTTLLITALMPVLTNVITNLIKKKK